ncbi:hypothetical protein RB200_23110 [Streptomyces sp. PmtG]
MNGHITDAALQLDVASTSCHYLAASLARDLPSAAPGLGSTVERQTLPKLNDIQYRALASLAAGGGALHEHAQRAPRGTRVATVDGTRIAVATLRALAKRRLVSVGEGASLPASRPITVTELGRRALTQQRPARLPATTVAAAPAVPVAQSARR